MVGDNMRHWKGKVFGPVSMAQEIFQKDTCYEGGIFYVDIEIPTDYPFKPPKVSPSRLTNLDEIRYKVVAPQRVFVDWSHLLGHPEE